jgi:GNAT superfamily N-acetyltransferase|tara:strand:- start:115 stop:549 length:435 start_codon:yes stop_codon:yes gene_type:complete
MPLIRPIDETDLEDVLEMIHGLAVHHCDVAPVTVEDLRRDALGPALWVQILVAPAMGYAALTPLAQMQFAVRGMDMHHLFVREVVRGQGVGRALIDASLAWAKSQGARYLNVGTHPDDTAAQDVYLAAGFEALDAAGPRFRMRW